MSLSGKFLYLISDDPPLEKTQQIGCMTGILKLFDRHHFRNLDGNKRITEGRPWYSLGSPKRTASRIEYNDARASVDSRKSPRRMLGFKEAVKDSFRKEEKSRPVEVDEFPYRLSPGLRNRSHRRMNSTELTQIPCHSTSSSLSKLEDAHSQSHDLFGSIEFVSSRFVSRHRYSCDGRDLSRPPPAVDHMDAYRSSSLRALEFPRLSSSVDSPSRTRRPPNVVAKLMGLDDIPESLLPPATPARKATTEMSMHMPSPRRPYLVGLEDMPKSLLTPVTPARKATTKKSMYMPSPRRPSLMDLDDMPLTPATPARKATMEKSMHMPSPRRPSLVGLEDMPLTPATPARKATTEMPMHMPSPRRPSLVGLDDKPESLLAPATPARKTTEISSPRRPSLEISSPRPVAGKMLLDMIQQPICVSEAKLKAQDFKNTDTEPLVATTKPAKLVDKSDSFWSCFSPASATFNPNTPLQKNLLVEDQNPRNIISECVTQTFNVSDNASPRRSKPTASKLPKEKSNATSPRKPASSRYKTEILPKSPPKIDAKDQRKRKEMRIRLDKTNINKDGDTPAGRRNSASKFNDRSPKANRRRVTADVTTEAKAEHKRTAKLCENEVVPARPIEKSSEAPKEPSLVSVLDQSFCSEDNSPSPAIKRALNFLENEAKLPDPLERTDERIYDESLKKAEDHMASTSEKYFLSSSKSKDRKVEEYVTQLFRVCGLLKYGNEERDVSMDLYSSRRFSIDPEIFRELEKKYINVKEEDTEYINRLLVFDTVNEILQRKSGVPPYARLPHKRGGCPNGKWKMSGRDLVTEIVAELQRLTSVEWGDICDGVCKVLDKDLQTSQTDENDEVGEVILDVERAIFRDLMDEFVFSF